MDAEQLSANVRQDGSVRRAHSSYQAQDLTGRLEGADPHRLVALCYEELLHALAVLRAANASGAAIGAHPQTSRAVSILYALESGLDLRAGGQLSLSLAAVYRAMRRDLSQAARDADASKLAEIAEGVLSLSQAWAAIAPKHG